MYVGIFGDVIFSVGHLRVLTPSNFKGTTGANWAEHEVLGGKARAEYLSPKLREYTFDILLDAALGVNPRKMLNRLTEMSENGEIHYLIIGFAPVSQNKFRVTEISDSWDRQRGRKVRRGCRRREESARYRGAARLHPGLAGLGNQ